MRNWISGTAALLLVLAGAGTGALAQFTTMDESINLPVENPVEQDFSEGAPVRELRTDIPPEEEIPPEVPPVSIHQSEQEYYNQLDAETEAEWDAVKAAAREKLPVKKTVLPKSGASSPGPFTLEKEVFGWHPYWEGTGYTNYTFDLLSTVAYFSYEANPYTGYATTMNSWSNTPLVEWAHSNGTEVVLCVTMFSGHTNFFASAAAQSNLINELVRVINLRSADGVNIDFEGVPSGSRDALTAFMSNLTVKMHAQVPGSQVSICLPAVDWSSNFDVAAYEGFLDKCIIMGYDYSWSTDTQAGPVAPLTGSTIFSSWCVQKSVSNYLNLGLSPGKLLLGCPYYGFDWPTVSYAMHANTTGSGTSRIYPLAESYADSYGYNWDTNSLTPYVLYGSYRQIWYDDTNSLARKYDFANSKDLAGIGIWALNYDEGTSDLWDLLAEKFTGDAVWQSRSSGTATNFYGVGAKASSFAAVGAGGAIFTSADDGVTWTPRTSGTSSMLLNFTSGSGLWVAVGDAGAVVTSVGGATWTVRTTPTNAMLRGAAYSVNDDVFVAAGANGTILRSTDGSNWVKQTSGTTENLQGVNYAGNLFIATGENSVLLTSSDGASWTSRTSNAAGWLLDAAYGNGTYVAVGLGSRVVTSSDGTTWTRQTNDLPSASANLYRVAFGNGQFAAVGQNGVIWGSTNGVNWTAETSGTTNFLRGVVYSNGLFVASGFNGTILTKGVGAPSVTIQTAGATVPNATSSQTITGAANTYVTGTMRWTNTLGGSGTFSAAASWSFSASLAVGTNLITVTATNSAGASASDSVTFIREASTGGSGAEDSASTQPSGGLSDIVVFTSAGHGLTGDTGSWLFGRGLTYGMVEDIGNVDQLNYFAEYCFKAGATVVPMRPLGNQTNEVVLDNTNSARVTFGGNWSNSTSTIFYGTAGSTPYRYAYVNATGTTAWAIYRPNIPAAGFYPVYAWTRSGSDRVKQLYRVYHSGGVTDVRVNHRRVGLGWVWLGTYYFDAGTNASVNISNYAPGGYLSTDVVIADAIRWGNGMGDINRGSGVSGFERELEASRYWVQSMTGQGMSSTLYDLVGYSDSDDNVGAPVRMAAEMNREADGGFWDRIYLGFHSNADGGAGTARGPMGLYDTRGTTEKMDRQKDYGTLIAREFTNDLGYGQSGVLFLDGYANNSANLYGSAYGELYGDVNAEMNSTIIETAFHNNSLDANLLKCPSARRVMAMSSYQAIVKHLTTNNPTVVSPVLLPDSPTHVSAANNGAGNITLKWRAPVTNIAGGHAATGYIIYRSTNGYGFGNPVTVSGGSTLSATLTNMTLGQTYYFQVCATNTGGESLSSKTVGARVSPAGFAPHLVVNGFERNDRNLDPAPYIANNILGNVARVIPRRINSQDYVVQHGSAIAAGGRYFNSCDNEAVEDGDVALTNYHAAYWILGEESTADDTFNSTEQGLVQTFLNGGGNLFVSGAELGWDLGRAGVSSAADVTFFTNVLKTAYVSDDAATDKATGRTGSILSGMSALTFSETAGEYIYGAEYPDVFSGRGGATTALVYGTSSAGTSAAAIQYSNVYRLVVMGFPFETILDASASTNFMKRTLIFFGDSPMETPVLDITSGNSTVVNATASTSISGTNNVSTVGSLRWTNALTGGTGTEPAAAAWTISSISLNVGTNLITVRGTNMFGASSSDSVTIVRQAAASGWPTIFADDFEDGDLAGWTQGEADHWTNSTVGPITGSRSLKHNLASVESNSWITAAPVYSLSGTQTVWRFSLKNGNWDPSSDNRFHVYLMASESNLGGSAVDGYAVGINLTGISDTVMLWRVSNGAAAGTIVQSTLDWNSGHTNAIEVTRSADGLWELKLDNGGGFDSLVSAGTGVDTTYTDTSYFGLFFDYTSTRAGQVWMDDVAIWQTNSVATDSDGDGIPDWWEIQNFGSATGATASADTDGDTASNWAEWIALTQPTNINSVFWIETEPVRAGGTNVVSWPSASGRTYDLYWNVNLTSTFGSVASELAATPPVNVYTDAVHKTEALIYYRVKVTK